MADLPTLSAFPDIINITVATPDPSTHTSAITVIYRARVEAQYFTFPMTYSATTDADLPENAFTDTAKINDALEPYGYQLP